MAACVSKLQVAWGAAVTSAVTAAGGGGEQQWQRQRLLASRWQPRLPRAATACLFNVPGRNRKFESTVCR